MVCDEMIKAREQVLGRKLTKTEKKKIMREMGHTEEEIAEELEEELIYA